MKSRYLYKIITLIIVGMLIMECPLSVYAEEGDVKKPIPEGVEEVKDPVSGEIRYRLSNEMKEDPRTYTYEEMMISESGYEPEGLESYDEQDNYRDIVTIDNFDAYSSYYNDGYNIQNLKIWLANYMYYFTQDKDAHYECSVVPGSFKTVSDYGGTIKFKVTLGGEEITCEYHKKFKMFGFKSGYGDMSLKAQFVISERGHHVSRKTLQEYANGTLNDLTNRSANYKRICTEKVWILDAEWKGQTLSPNKWFYLDEGADVNLMGFTNYSETRIRNMLIYLEKKSGGAVEFTDCQKELVKFYGKTGADIAGMLAIIVVGGCYKEGSGADYWNFFNCRTPENGTVVQGKNIWNAKADCKTEGEAMVASFQWIYKNYWLNGQNTYYKMSFNDYGRPQSAEEAASAKSPTHCYSPWFTDAAYINSGYDDYYAWCNKCARARQELIKAAE